jgi:hypothetical protein
MVYKPKLCVIVNNNNPKKKKPKTQTKNTQMNKSIISELSMLTN